MISIDEIDKAILELEAHDTTYATVERLAWLYTVKDHLIGQPLTKAATPNYSSDFLAAASTCDIDVLLSILNEHFEVVKAICPREYDEVIAKITLKE